MIRFGNFEFELTINDKVQEIDPINFSFSIRDSIHKLFPEMSMEIMDVTGFLQEVMLFTEGMPVKLKYGLEQGNTISCPFGIVNEELPGTMTYDSIGGKVFFQCVHDWYYQQEVKGDAYEGRITEVIKNKLIDNYAFTNIDLIRSGGVTGWNDTGCENTWYRPLMNQKDFIEKILLPNAYSNNAFDSPFFCFIDSNNEFNFRNYHSMTSTDPVKKISMLNFSRRPDIDDDSGGTRIEDGVGDRFIFSFKRWKTGAMITKKLRNRSLFLRDRETGEYEYAKDAISSYPKQSQGYLPIMQDPLTSGVYDQNYKESGSMLECQKGRKINSMKDSFFLERFVMTVPLDTTLRAGKLIEITLPLKIQQDTANSLNYTGKYLIESSDHVWESSSKFGYTQLVISRKFQSVPNTSLILGKLMKGV